MFLQDGELHEIFYLLYRESLQLQEALRPNILCNILELSIFFIALASARILMKYEAEVWLMH